MSAQEDVPPMNARERFGWWISGEISEVIAEEFDSTADALFQPTATVCLVWALAYTGGSLIAADFMLSTVAGVVIAAFAVLGSMYAIITVLASYEFATSTTHDVLDEVSV
jgi:hypothetical protein